MNYEYIDAELRGELPLPFLFLLFFLLIISSSSSSTFPLEYSIIAPSQITHPLLTCELSRGIYLYSVLTGQSRANQMTLLKIILVNLSGEYVRGNV